jgi:hypothetical protein
MLHSIRLRNYRSFADTGAIHLGKLNIFIGPNNAGKTSLVNAVELFLRSLRTGPRQDPLVFEEMPSFASFDSVLRRHWSPKEQRPTEIALTYAWSVGEEKPATCEFICRGHPQDNNSYVARADYSVDDKHVQAVRKTVSPGRHRYEIDDGSRKFLEDRMFFTGAIPFPTQHASPTLKTVLDRARSRIRLEVINPYRPVPRSYYVLDDPSLTQADRELLSFLVRIWSSEEVASRQVQRRLISTLESLGLARQFEVKQISKRLGPKVVEIRVAPTIRRHKVTIADAGFGLSQALPLAAFDARLSRGYLIAYQPEVHLHPFAQSRLADVFARSLGRQNQVFVETHSPDMILRLQAQIAKGDLQPEDVRVLCVENIKGKSQVRAVELDSGGSPKIPWPSGFLDTSLSLARELASERQKKDA